MKKLHKVYPRLDSKSYCDLIAYCERFNLSTAKAAEHAITEFLNTAPMVSRDHNKLVKACNIIEGKHRGTNQKAALKAKRKVGWFNTRGKAA